MNSAPSASSGCTCSLGTTMRFPAKLYDSGLKVLGFLTSEHFDDPQLAGHVSVYLPESYNFAGNLIVVPREHVHPLDADGAEFMAFIISGGVTDMNAAKTIVDAPAR